MASPIQKVKSGNIEIAVFKNSGKTKEGKDFSYDSYVIQRSYTINKEGEVFAKKYFPKVKIINKKIVNSNYKKILGFLQKGDKPKNIHYFSDKKPWMMRYNEFEDVITWYKMASEAIAEYKLNPGDIFLKTDGTCCLPKMVCFFVFERAVSCQKHIL